MRDSSSRAETRGGSIPPVCNLQFAILFANISAIFFHIQIAANIQNDYGGTKSQFTMLDQLSVTPSEPKVQVASGDVLDVSV